VPLTGVLISTPIAVPPGRKESVCAKTAEFPTIGDIIKKQTVKPIRNFEVFLFVNKNLENLFHPYYRPIN
jgi:hypothetical protein